MEEKMKGGRERKRREVGGDQEGRKEREKERKKKENHLN